MFKVFNHFSLEQDKKLINSIGNNQLVVLVFINIGAIMREDSLTYNTQPLALREIIRSLMMSEVYQEPEYPDHEKVSRQVEEYYQRTVGSDEVL